jgi:hypothetical protein
MLCSRERTITVLLGEAAKLTFVRIEFDPPGTFRSLVRASSVGRR